MTSLYSKTAISYLTGQFVKKPRVSGLISSMVEPLDTLAKDLQALKEQRWIDTAQGLQLDNCGYIVGILRMGRSDEAYRTAIKAQILSNISYGTPGDLINGVRFLTAATEVQYLESYPACAMLFTNGENVPTGSQQVLQDIAPAAIENMPLLVSYGRVKPLRTGRLSHPNNLSVASVEGEESTFTANDSQLIVGEVYPQGTSGLSGMPLTTTKFIARSRRLKAGIGFLAVNSYRVHDNGYHLSGVFQ